MNKTAVRQFLKYHATSIKNKRKTLFLINMHRSFHMEWEHNIIGRHRTKKIIFAITNNEVEIEISIDSKQYIVIKDKYPETNTIDRTF